MGPTIGYDELVSAMEGRRALPAWQQLAELLEHRIRWRFRISTDGLTLHWVLADRRVWAPAGVRRTGRRWTPEFTAWR